MKTYGYWYIEVLDSDGNTGEDPSITIDKNNYPHISYLRKSSEDLMYIYYNGIFWIKILVDSSDFVGNSSSLKLDSDDYPHISYFDYLGKLDLNYAKWNGSGWEYTVVDSTGWVGTQTSLDLDSNDYPHIVYREDPMPVYLKYAEWNGLTWDIEMVDNTGDLGYHMSLCLDSNDYPHISYYDNGNGDLKYAVKTSTGWQIETVDSTGDVGEWTSLELDSNDYPHISYYDSTNETLKYTKWNGLDWEFTIVDSVEGDSYCLGTSLELDSNDYPHISYYDNGDDNLKYARWDGASWIIKTIDEEGNVGQFSSLALDDYDYPHIAYYDWTNGDLKYATIRYSISGIVYSPEGLPMEKVKVKLSGYKTDSVRTDSSGRFEFYGLIPQRDYIITADRNQYEFTPAQHMINDLYKNESVTFNATKQWTPSLWQFGTFPNPCNLSEGQTAVKFFNLPEHSKIQIYSVDGTLITEILPETADYNWNLTNKDGEIISSGIYFFVITTPNEIKKGKIAIIK